MLLTATAVIALEAELVSGALEATASALGLSTVFLGVIVLALIGTASDLFAASFFARQGKMGLALNICVGSAIQVALVVAPLLVLGSWVIGQPMTLVFDNPLNLFAVAGTALIVNAIASDGGTTWFEGVLLIGVYALIGLAFSSALRPDELVFSTHLESLGQRAFARVRRSCKRAVLSTAMHQQP